MKPLYLFSPKVWRGVSLHIAHARSLILFLDYDGTLTPICSTPDAAVLSDETRRLLCRMETLPSTHCVLITGRSMNDIQSLVRIPSMWIAANHGFHIRRGKFEWVHPAAKNFSTARKQIMKTCNPLVRRFKGAWMEDKQYTLSIHYRLVAPSKVSDFKRKLLTLLQPYRPKIKLTRGKKVIEIRPPAEWGKGHAVNVILQRIKVHQKPLLIAIGDDRTDEAMFQRIEGEGLTIRVGYSQCTGAQYYVRSTEEVTKLIYPILQHRTLKERERKKE
ncbi:MAG TPA: trehalose-phosphatase [Bacteroidota bacterium]|nr:trehalose-phosphatase [Bacteroidota bacterium]